VDANSTLSFTTDGGKVIQGTILYSLGYTTIAASEIRFLAAGALRLGSAFGTVVSGGVTFYSPDISGGIIAETLFSYDGNPATPLRFQSPAQFLNVFEIVSGTVIIDSLFVATNTSTIRIREVASLSINGIDPHVFHTIASVSSQTTVTLHGSATFAGPVSVSTLELLDSSSAAFQDSVVVLNFTTAGKTTTAKNITAITIVSRGATLGGPGAYISLTHLNVLPSPLGALNTYLATSLYVFGNATLALAGLTVVFEANSNFVIAPSGNVVVSADSSFNFDFAPARITLEGFITVGAAFSSNVDILGRGNISVVSGRFFHAARAVTGATVSVAALGTAVFEADTLNFTAVYGNGNLNVSTNAAAQSSLGTVHVGNLHVYGGVVSATSFQSNTLTISFGDFHVLNTGVVSGNFLFSAGSVIGLGNSTQVTSQVLTFESGVYKWVNAITLLSKSVVYNCPPQTVLVINGAQIITG
jgi:hypothetical protein